MNNNEWLDIDVLEDYLDGKLDAKAMHRVERLSLEDPFVAEALAGLSQSPKRVQSLSLLQKQLQDRIAQKPIVQKRWQITSQRLSIAAAAAVLFVTVSLLFWMREKDSRDQLAANTPKKVEVAIAPVPTPAKPDTQMEKAVAEAKENVYAGNAKKVAEKPASPAIATVMADAVNENSTLAFRSTAIPETKVLKENRVAPALAGRVMGLQIQNSKNTVNGVVFGEDSLPIVGASVKMKGIAIGTITNEKGEFNLNADSLLKNQKLNVSYLGYQSKEVNVKKGESLGIQLVPDNSTLNEVVIIGNNVAKRSSATMSASFIRPEPVGGWDKFQAYLITNNRLLVAKKTTGKHITVSFELAKDGTPINISASPTSKSAEPLSAAEEQEAIRLLKEGPKWVLPDKSTSGSTTVNIRF